MGEPVNAAGRQLRSVIERVERLNEEIASLRRDVNEVYAEAKSSGFDTKVIKHVIKLRGMDPYSRQELEALTDIYMHSIGMAADTPLGDAARQRLSEPQDPEDEDAPEGGEDGRAAPGEPDERPKSAPVFPEVSDEDLEEAAALGGAAAKEGTPILKNPYLADDPRRAAWDQGWCREIGSDGMDIPKAFQRRTPKKPKDEKEGGDT